MKNEIPKGQRFFRVSEHQEEIVKYIKHSDEIYTSYKKVSEDDLQHFGIPGMQWGKRRYQNKDGSYTAAGREHYGIGDSLKKAANSVGSAVSGAAKKAGDAVSGAANNATNWVKSATSSVTNYVRGKRVEAIQSKGEKQMQAVRERKHGTNYGSDSNGRAQDKRRQAMSWARTVQNNPKAIGQCMQWMWDEAGRTGADFEKCGNLVYSASKDLPEDPGELMLERWLRAHSYAFEQIGITNMDPRNMAKLGKKQILLQIEARQKELSKELEPYREAFKATKSARKNYTDPDGIANLLSYWFERIDPGLD